MPGEGSQMAVTVHDMSIRVLPRDEMQTVMDWAAREGWNPGLHDAECFHAVDPGGFLLGERNGRPISSLSAVTYPDNFAFIGFYFVEPAFRGRGFGFKTWRAGLRRLSGYNIGLDGVIGQQQNYAKSGFILAWRNLRYSGRIATSPGPIRVPGGRIVPLSTVPFAVVEAYDRRHFPASRPAFLNLWTTRSGTRSLAFLRDGRLAGYGVVRPCRRGFKIGPLFADDAAIADALFGALAAKVGASELLLDVPEPNLAAVRMAERHGLRPVFETARMYTGPAPDISLREVFGITSFELG